MSKLERPRRVITLAEARILALDSLTALEAARKAQWAAEDKLVDELKAKLAESQRIIGLQAAALEVWKNGDFSWGISSWGDPPDGRGREGHRGTLTAMRIPSNRRPRPRC